MQKSLKVKDLPAETQSLIHRDIKMRYKALGYTEQESVEIADAAMALTVWELSDDLNIQKYL